MTTSPVMFWKAAPPPLPMPSIVNVPVWFVASSPMVSVPEETIRFISVSLTANWPPASAPMVTFTPTVLGYRLTSGAVTVPPLSITSLAAMVMVLPTPLEDRLWPPLSNGPAPASSASASMVMLSPAVSAVRPPPASVMPSSAAMLMLPLVAVMAPLVVMTPPPPLSSLMRVTSVSAVMAPKSTPAVLRSVMPTSPLLAVAVMAAPPASVTMGTPEVPTLVCACRSSALAVVMCGPAPEAMMSPPALLARSERIFGLVLKLTVATVMSPVLASPMMRVPAPTSILSSISASVRERAPAPPPRPTVVPAVCGAMVMFAPPPPLVSSEPALLIESAVMPMVALCVAILPPVVSNVPAAVSMVQVPVVLVTAWATSTSPSALMVTLLSRNAEPLLTNRTRPAEPVSSALKVRLPAPPLGLKLSISTLSSWTPLRPMTMFAALPAMDALKSAVRRLRVPPPPVAPTYILSAGTLCQMLIVSPAAVRLPVSERPCA